MPAPSTVAVVTSLVYTVTAGGTQLETIANVPPNTGKAAFLAELIKGDANQTWNDSGIAAIVVSGNRLVVTAQDGITQVTYQIVVINVPTPPILEAVYATPGQVRTYTTVPALAALDDATLTAKIFVAMTYIDRFAGAWPPWYVGQIRKFPRWNDVDQLGNKVVPDSIMLATIAQLEFMFLNMPDGDHGITADSVQAANISYSPRLRSLMHGFVTKLGSAVFPLPQNLKIGQPNQIEEMMLNAEMPDALP